MRELQNRLTPQRLAGPWNKRATAPDHAIDVYGAGARHDYAGLMDYWRVIRRHRLAVTVAMVLGAAAGLLKTLPEPRMYQARTTIEMQGLNEEFLNLKNISPTVSENATIDSDIQTQIRILQSQFLTDRVRQRLEAGRPTEELQPPDRLGAWRKALRLSPRDQESLWQQALSTASEGLKVRAVGTTRIVEISCDSTHPVLAADFCNTLAQAYREENLDARWKTTEQTGTWLTQQLQDLKKKLDSQQQELQAYARATGLTFRSDTNDQEAKLGDIQEELFRAQADRIEKQSRYEMASTSPASALPEVLDDPVLKDSQRVVADLQKTLAQLRITYTESHAEVRKVQAQISAIESSLSAARSNVITRIRKEYEGAQRRETLLAGAYKSQAGLVAAKAEQTAQYSLLKGDADASRLLYQTLLQRLREASIASALRANTIRVIDRAAPPAVPYKPGLRRTTTLGLLFGAVLGTCLVVVRDRADRTLQDPGDGAYYLGMVELGVVPTGELRGHAGFKTRLKSAAAQLKPTSVTITDPSAHGVELMSLSRKSSPLAESIRTALTSILFSGPGGSQPRIVVLTSSGPREGKTTVVSNLGISLAEINRSVLLIDGDMRRPRLHTVFDVPNDSGLSDLLRDPSPFDQASFEGACMPTSISGLYVLPSGRSRNGASALLHSPRLPQLLLLAREKFTTVLVDTPPLLSLADARLFARFSDVVVLVVRSGVTTRDAALLAKEQIAEDGTPVLGMILNFWNPKTPGYSHYGYSSAGDSYRDEDAGPDGGPTLGTGVSDVDRVSGWKPGFPPGSEVPAGGAAREREG